MRRQTITASAIALGLLSAGAPSALGITRIAPPVSLNGTTAQGPVLYDLRLGSADLLKVTVGTPASAMVRVIAPDLEGEYVRTLPLAQPRGGVIAPRSGVYLLRVEPGPTAGPYRATIGVQRAVRITLSGRRVSPGLLSLGLSAKDGVGGEPKLSASLLGRRGAGAWVRLGRIGSQAGAQRVEIPKSLRSGAGKLELLARHDGSVATRPARDHFLVAAR